MGGRADDEFKLNFFLWNMEFQYGISERSHWKTWLFSVQLFI